MLSSFPTWSPAGRSPKGGQSWAPRGGGCTSFVRAGQRRRRESPPAKTIREAGDYRSPRDFLSNDGSALQLARLLDQRLGVAHLELARRLDVERLDDAVLDQHRVALRANPHAARGQVEGQAGRLGEIGAAV